MPKLASIVFAALMLAAGAPARAGENETFAAAQNFISALKELETTQQRYRDLIKAAKIASYEPSPICAALNPAADDAPDDPVELGDLLRKSNLSRPDARALCEAFAAQRVSLEKATAANLAAASACAAHRVPACDAANAAVAAQREARARLDIENRQ